MTNEAFRVLLLRYFQSGKLDISDKLLAMVSPILPFRKNARVISNSFKQLKSFEEKMISMEVDVEKYVGSNVVAENISDCLREKIGELLIGAYVHGSVGTYEEVSYSDFDGLVILKNKTFETSENVFLVAKVLKETEMMMREMDPLQHHGWFIMTEFDLTNFPETYFPHELFFHSKCLTGENKILLKVREKRFQNNFDKSFQRLSQSILNKLETQSFLENQYLFKNLLSEFMLLPSIYIQAKTCEGIFKKFSFEKVQLELKEKYEVMNEISAIRAKWNFVPSKLFLSKLKARHGMQLNSSAKKCSGNISDEMRNKFNGQLILRMKEFVSELNLRVLK